MMLILLTPKCKQDKQGRHSVYNLTAHTGNTGWSIYIDILYSPYSRMVTYCSKNTKKEMVKRMHGWGVSAQEVYTVSHHSSTALRRHLQSSMGAQPAGSSSTASSMTTVWKHYLGHHSQPSNTALWGTQQTGLAFHTQAAALPDNWLCVTVQSNRTNTMGSTEIWWETGALRFTALYFSTCTQSSLLWISI